jgi:hypothetical protein
MAGEITTTRAFPCGWRAAASKARHGATNDIGAEAVDGKVSMSDLHATILHLLGLKIEKLTYPFADRDVRLRDNPGAVIEEILA